MSEDGNTIVAGGAAPVMTEQITGDINLKLTENYKVYALTSSGERKLEIPVTSDGEWISFNLTNDMHSANFEIIKPGHYETVRKSDEIINQNFDNVLINTSKNTDNTETELSDGITYKSRWTYSGYTWETTDDGNGGKMFRNNIGKTSGESKIYFYPKQTVKLAADDELCISFDYKQKPGLLSDGETEGVTNTFEMGLNKSTNTVLAKSISSNPYVWLKDSAGKNSLIYINRRGSNGGTYKPQITLGRSDYNGYEIKNDTWYTVTLTLKMSDSEKDGIQTAQLSVTEKDGSFTGVLKGLLDSNYTGTVTNTNTQIPDGAYDKYTEFSCAELSLGCSKDNEWEYCMDNLKITHTYNDTVFIPD